MHALLLTALRRVLLAGALAASVVAPALADSTPIGKLPAGPVASVTTHRGLFVAVALPHPADRSLVWRLARTVDPKVLHEVAEADVGKMVVIVFAATGKGKASIVYALTRGDTSSKALRTVTHAVTVSS